MKCRVCGEEITNVDKHYRSEHPERYKELVEDIDVEVHVLIGLIQRLEDYVQHQSKCGSQKLLGGGECTCGARDVVDDIRDEVDSDYKK